MTPRVRTLTSRRVAAAALTVFACSATDRSKLDLGAAGGADASGNAGSSAAGRESIGDESAAGTAGATTSTPPDEQDIVLDGEFPIPLRTGLAPTPPMGWSSWNSFACAIKATDVVKTADAIVSSGMKDAGYIYVNIDDCWQEAARDAAGNVQVSAAFLQGYGGTLQTLVDYVHSLGLKLGLYSDRGTETCGHRAGAKGYEKQDAAQYAAWGIDYLKYDNCAADPATIQADYQAMRDALESAVAASSAAAPTLRRPIVYSLCAWNFYEWGTETGQLWRTTLDITPVWESSGSEGSVLTSAILNSQYAAYNGPNAWNDPDMLEVGVGKLSNSEAEQRSHFNLWAIMASPLIAGNDVTKMSDAARTILTNKQVIAINQDPLGLQGFPVRKLGLDNQLEIWLKPLNGHGLRGVLLLNRSASPSDITLSLADLNLAPGPVRLEDLWTGEVQDNVRTPYTALAVPGHGSVMLKVKGVEPPPPSGTRYLSDLNWIYAANGNGPVERDLTVGTSAAGDGKPLTLDGATSSKGLGVSGGSKIIYRLGKACSRFTAKVNLDEAMTTAGSVVFKVWGDGTLLYTSPVMTADSATQTVDVPVTDVYRLTLSVTNGMDTVSSADRGVWADAKVECQ